MGLLDGQPLERSKRLNNTPLLTDVVGYSDTTVLYMLSLQCVSVVGLERRDVVAQTNRFHACFSYSTVFVLRFFRLYRGIHSGQAMDGREEKETHTIRVCAAQSAHAVAC
jgi:hypothetical protein